MIFNLEKSFHLQPSKEIIAIRQGPTGDLFLAGSEETRILGKTINWVLPEPARGGFIAMHPNLKFFATRGGIYSTTWPFKCLFYLGKDILTAAWGAEGKRFSAATAQKIMFFNVAGDIETDGMTKEIEFGMTNIESISWTPQGRWTIKKTFHEIMWISENPWTQVLQAPGSRSIEKNALVTNSEGKSRFVVASQGQVRLYDWDNAALAVYPKIKVGPSIWGIDEGMKKRHALIVQGANAVYVVDYEGEIVALAQAYFGKIPVTACLSLNGKQLFTGTVNGYIFCYTLEDSKCILDEVCEPNVPNLMDFETVVSRPSPSLEIPFDQVKPDEVFLLNKKPAVVDPEPQVEIEQKVAEQIFSRTGRPIRSCRIAEKSLKAVKK